MSEIEKMYESAGVDYEERYNNCILNKEGECKLKCSCDICKYSEEKYIYPPFTAEKVLKVVLFFLNKGVKLSFSVEEHAKISVENFKECIAYMVSKYWQDLTEKEKQQVKGILE